MKYIFKAKTESGIVKEGKVEASNREAAIQVLESNGLILLALEEEQQVSGFIKEIQRISEGVNQKELVIFFHELAVLIESKVPIVPSLEAIGDDTKNKYLQTVIKEIANDVEDGMALSESFAKHPKTFSSLTINMMRAGEISGNLEQAIQFIASNIEKNYQLTSKVKGALVYPAFVISAAAVTGFLAATIILPRLTEMIADMDVEVPWYTAAVMSFADFMSSYWWSVILVVAGIVGGFVYYLKSDTGKEEWDNIVLKVPVLGKLLHAVYIARFSDNLAALMIAGIPVVKALNLVGEVVGNAAYRDLLQESVKEVRTGGNISGAFMRSEMIPPLVSQMIRVGEESGKISDILKKIARFYEQEADNLTRSLASLIEPILIVVLGLGVALLVFSVLVPMYSLVGQIS